MGWAPRPGRIFRWPRRSRAQVRCDVDAELAHHLDLVAEQCERGGLSPDEARAEARRRFGDLEGARRHMVRDGRRFEARDRMRALPRTIVEDLAYALRTFTKQPGFALVTVGTLSVGIATATIFFGAVWAILLQPLALEAPDRVVGVWGTEIAEGVQRDGLAPATVADVRERSRSFVALAAAQPHGFDVEGPSGPTAINAWIVSEDFFAVLNTLPAVGRLLGPADIGPDAQPAVVITHTFWMSHFGGNRDAVGGTLTLDGVPFRVVGVLPLDFPERSRPLIVPRPATGDLWESRFATFFTGFGRLAPGVSIEAARTELDEIAGQLAVDYPAANEGRGFDLAPLRDSMLEDVSAGLWLLFGGALLILVISGINAAGLLLAQAATRTRELAIRAAVGAGQGRLLRQLFTETGLLASMAALIAVPVAAAGLGVFRRLSPPGMPRVDELAPDFRIAVFAAVAAFALALVAGLVPAVRVARPDLYEVLKPGGRSGTLTPASSRLRSLLVGTEVAIAVILLVGGGLLLRSWERMLDADQGYRAEGITAVEAHYWQFAATGAIRAEFARAVTDRLRSTPGVTGATVTTALPLAAQIGNEDGEISRPGDPRPTVTRWMAIGPDYFDVMGVSLTAGRPFTRADAGAGEAVVILSAEAARRLWPGHDMVGETVLVGGDSVPTPTRVVGVAEDVRYAGLESPAEPTIYLPHAQAPVASVYFVVRTTAGSGLPALREALSQLQPALVPAGDVSLDDAVAAARQPRRFSLLLLSAFGLTALLLTIVGLFGHLSHSIRTREHELGVRMALGAWPGRLIQMVLRQGVLLVAAGSIIGLLLAFGLSRFMSSLLYEVAPSDPMTFAASALLVLGVGVAASYLPARRLSRLDPAVSLRVE